MLDPQLPQKLKAWFNSTGLPLEIEAGRQFFRGGFGAEHSAVYADPETQGGREIDVLAYRRDHTGCFAILVPVECKASQKPWLVLKDSERYRRIGARSIATMSSEGRIAMANHISECLQTYHSVFGPANGGYALRQAFSGQDDQAFKACMSALKAAVSLVENQGRSIDFAIPTIVVDAPIFEYTETLEGTQTFTPVISSSFAFSAHIEAYRSCVIHLVSKEHLPEHVKRCSLLFANLQRLFADDILEFVRRNT